MGLPDPASVNLTEMQFVLLLFSKVCMVSSVVHSPWSVRSQCSVSALRWLGCKSRSLCPNQAM